MPTRHIYSSNAAAVIAASSFEVSALSIAACPHALTFSRKNFVLVSMCTKGRSLSPETAFTM